MSSKKSEKVVAEKVVASVAEKKTKTAKAAVVAVVAAPVAVAAPVEKKQRVKKVKEDKPVEKKVVEEEEKKEPVKKVPATSETVMTDLVSVIDSLSKAKVGDLKDLKSAFRALRSTASTLKGLRNDLTRVLKKTNRTKVPKDKSKLSNSGLMKPVAISKDLAQFMGVAADSLHSRVSVTNAICNYIKEKNLQNPANKRQINPDANLAKILAYSSSNGQPLTYFYIQQLIQPHFLKELSADMSKFLGVADKSMQSTSAVVSGVTAYATKKGLVHDGSVKPDETLSKLFGKSTEFPVSSLPQLVKTHFRK